MCQCIDKLKQVLSVKIDNMYSKKSVFFKCTDSHHCYKYKNTEINNSENIHPPFSSNQLLNNIVFLKRYIFKEKG